MRRRLIPAVTLVLFAAACASSDAEDPSTSYFQEAALVSSRYESAAAAHFSEYRISLEAATQETGDEIFVDANKGLFSSLANEFGSAISNLGALTPPDAVAEPHDAWLAAGRALNDAFQATDDQLATLTEAVAVNSVVSTVPLAELQKAYREACEAVAALSEGDPLPVIACDPSADGA